MAERDVVRAALKVVEELKAEVEQHHASSDAKFNDLATGKQEGLGVWGFGGKMNFKKI